MRYMLLIYGPDNMGAATDEAMAAEFREYGAYSQWLVDKGIFKAGEPLAPTADATSVRLRDGRRLVTDGPFAETKEVLGGYYIIECDDLDTAIEAAGRCPGARSGTMEVRPIAEMAEPGGTG